MIFFLFSYLDSSGGFVLSLLRLACFGASNAKGREEDLAITFRDVLEDATGPAPAFCSGNESYDVMLADDCRFSNVGAVGRDILRNERRC